MWILLLLIILFVYLATRKDKSDESYTDLTGTKRIYIERTGTFVQDQPAFVM
jgi:hypothetical protein